MPKTVSTKTKTMNCKHVLAFFKKPERLHQTSLPKEVRAHVKRCPSCARRYTTLKATLTVFGTRADVRTPEAMRRYVERRLTSRSHE